MTLKPTRAMKRHEVHYLNCIDENCDLAECVDRRYSKSERDQLREKLLVAVGALKNVQESFFMAGPTDLEEFVANMEINRKVVNEALAKIGDVG